MDVMLVVGSTVCLCVKLLAIKTCCRHILFMSLMYSCDIEVLDVDVDVKLPAIEKGYRRRYSFHFDDKQHQHRRYNPMNFYVNI